MDTENQLALDRMLNFSELLVLRYVIQSEKKMPNYFFKRKKVVITIAVRKPSPTFAPFKTIKAVTKNKKKPLRAAFSNKNTSRATRTLERLHPSSRPCHRKSVDKKVHKKADNKPTHLSRDQRTGSLESQF